jgi:hypothetical protein
MKDLSLSIIDKLTDKSGGISSYGARKKEINLKTSQKREFFVNKPSNP